MCVKDLVPCVYIPGKSGVLSTINERRSPIGGGTGGSTGSDEKSQDGIREGKRREFAFQGKRERADGSSRNWCCDHGGWLEGMDHSRIYRRK